MTAARPSKLRAALAALTVGATCSQAGNIVGYVKMEVPTGLSLLAVPFQQVGGGQHTLGSFFGGKLGDGATVYLWTGQKYASYTYVSDPDPDIAGWYDSNFQKADDLVLQGGTGAWVKNPGDPLTFVMLGEVIAGQVPVSLPVGLRMIGSVFPVDVHVQQLTGLQPDDDDTIFLFGPQGYTMLVYMGDPDPEIAGWYDSSFQKRDIVVRAGNAFWYKSVNSKVWVQSLNP